jgi:hypothetical protein
MGRPEELTAAQQNTLVAASEIPPPRQLAGDGSTISFSMPGSCAALIEISRGADAR